MPSDRPPPDPTAALIADEPSDEGYRLPSSPSPAAVLELAASCVRFVLVALKLELDFTRETLPLLDHYLEQARGSVRERPETLPLVASAAGAYLGEVVRRLHRCWWRADSRDPLEWRLEFRDVFLCFHPVQMIQAALARPPDAPQDADPYGAASEIDDESSDAGDDDAALEDEDGAERAPAADSAASDGSDGGSDEAEPGLLIEDEDRERVRARLDRLPQVSDEEYWAPSTRLEVVEIVVEAIQSNLLEHPLRRRTRGPDDYE
jgi:hypothetical protein